MLVINSRFHLEQKALEELREEEGKLNYESLHWEKDDFILQLPKFKAERSDSKVQIKKDLKKQEETKLIQKEKKLYHKLPALIKTPNSIDMTKVKREPLTHSINNLKFERTRRPSIRDMGEIVDKNSKKKSNFFYSPRNQIQFNVSFYEKQLEKEYFMNKFDEVSKKYGFKPPLAYDPIFIKKDERKLVATHKIACQSLQFPNDFLNDLTRRFQ